MEPITAIRDRLRPFINRQRLVETATSLVGVPSPTGQGGAVANVLADILERDGFSVSRPEAGHPSAPAVVVRFDTGRPGRTLQFSGHLDVVHLPFVPPLVNDGRLTGSGSCDMKSGVAAVVEALRALRDAEALTAGAILLTAFDLHEAPWGFSQQLDRLIADGHVGDAVLIPEPLSDRLPVVGRGQACWKVTIRRPGPPVHEVMSPPDEPSVIAAGAELVARLQKLDDRLASQTDPLAGRSSVFIGQIHSGEIYNQYPQECWLEGTRRWLPGGDRKDVEREFRGLVEAVARDTNTTVETNFQLVRDAFFLDQTDPVVGAFESAYQATAGQALPVGPKPFVDDGNSFWALARVPAITHGPLAGGQHTTSEWVAIDDLMRVALVYAITAVVYCQAR
ncbi:MAG TPA: M20/M25/M40 family metallo-hydrolase [Isosphaeraceae bacterium]|jgi:acetylornithine deacetylase/succinyl-diaminopimelate desuccinylase-like protein|nr:M20/M25/M40 family metallo-hydrolase [Isosphaeraceae bacterium]